MKRLAAALIVIAVIAWAAVSYARRPHLPAAERGRRLAEHTGCFGCHGPGGTHGAGNPGRLDKTVPNFQDDVMMWAKTPDEIREWIHDGSTPRKRASQTWRSEREKGALRMPAFGKRLDAHQIDDLVAYVLVMSGTPDPEGDSLAAHGLARIEALGCDGCHGTGGRLARSNPGSFKGYVPSWDSADFPDLVRDSTEFREWVESGTSRRLDANPFARFFLRRAALHMPRYRDHLEADDVPALWAYVRWLRAATAKQRS